MAAFAHPPQSSEHLTPFVVNIPEAEISLLKTLLTLLPLAKPTWESSSEASDYGISRSWLSSAVTEWRDNFQWKAHEKILNSVPHFKMDVHGQSIHFAGLFSPNPKAIPILFLHGWPGSFLEFLPILLKVQAEYRSAPETLPFNLIVPSLPGYGFSSVPADQAFTAGEAASLFDSMMQELGFGSGYMVQGGDVGSAISRLMAERYDSVKAVHLNMFLIPRPEQFKDDPLSIEEKTMMDWGVTGQAYYLMHATRPSTIGLAIGSSPVALLSWIGEKMTAWSDKPLPLETILLNVSLYWFTGCYPSSIWPYREASGIYKPLEPTHPFGGTLANLAPSKPLGVSQFPKELALVPKAWVESIESTIFFRKHNSGGHFAALEEPDLLWGDVQEFARLVWKV